MKTSLMSGVALVGAVLAGGASAVTLDPLPIISGATVITLEDFSSSGTDHVEGAMYVGGDLNYSGYFKYNQDQVPELDIGGVQGGLVVGGNVNSNLQKSGANPGAAQIGGAYNGDPNTGGLTLNTGVTGIPVTEMSTLFEELSADLAGFGTTVGATFNSTHNALSISSGPGNAEGFSVLNLSSGDALDLFSPPLGQNLTLNRDPDVTGFFINIAGTDFTGANAINTQVFQNQLADSQYVILNFFEATAIDFDQNLNGTVLAPWAAINSPPGGMNGVMIARSLTQDGEIRPINKTGYIGTLPPSTVPLPPAGWALVAGIGLMGALRRRKAAA